MALQTSGASTCKAMHDENQPEDATPDNTPSCINLHSSALYCTSGQVTPTGFEPVLQA